MAFISTDKSRRFGGFTTLPWDSPSSGTYKGNDPQAFIFSLDHQTKLTCNNQSSVIYCRNNYGVIFGGNDIYITDNLESNSGSNCSCYGKNEGITNKFYLTGNTNDIYFTPVEVEVYQVKIV